MFYCSSFSFFQRVISEVPWPTAAKFCVMLGSMFYFITPVQQFGGCPLKTSEIRRDLKQLHIWPRISQEPVDISKTRDKVDWEKFLLHRTKKLANFCALMKKLWTQMLTHPKSTVHAILNNFGVWSWISLERIKISTTGNKHEITSKYVVTPCDGTRMRSSVGLVSTVPPPSIPCWAEKTGELWFTNKKVIGADVNPP